MEEPENLCVPRAWKNSRANTIGKGLWNDDVDNNPCVYWVLVGSGPDRERVAVGVLSYLVPNNQLEVGLPMASSAALASAAAGSSSPQSAGMQLLLHSYEDASVANLH